MADILTLPLFHQRCRIGQIRHLIICAAQLRNGDVANLSDQTSKELAEIWLMPETGRSFLTPRLENASVKYAELLEYCRDTGFRERLLAKFFTKLSLADTEWHTALKPLGNGNVISIIVGHAKSMRTAREHGLLGNTLENEQSVRQFAFGYTGKK